MKSLIVFSVCLMHPSLVLALSLGCKVSQHEEDYMFDMIFVEDQSVLALTRTLHLAEDTIHEVDLLNVKPVDVFKFNVELPEGKNVFELSKIYGGWELTRSEYKNGNSGRNLEHSRVKYECDRECPEYDQGQSQDPEFLITEEQERDCLENKDACIFPFNQSQIRELVLAEGGLEKGIKHWEYSIIWNHGVGKYIWTVTSTTSETHDTLGGSLMSLDAITGKHICTSGWGSVLD